MRQPPSPEVDLTSPLEASIHLPKHFACVSLSSMPRPVQRAHRIVGLTLAFDRRMEDIYDETVASQKRTELLASTDESYVLTIHCPVTLGTNRTVYFRSVLIQTKSSSSVTQASHGCRRFHGISLHRCTHSSQLMESAAPLLARASAMDSGDGSPDLRRTSRAPRRVPLGDVIPAGSCSAVSGAWYDPGRGRAKQPASDPSRVRWPVCRGWCAGRLIRCAEPAGFLHTNLALGTCWMY